MSDNTKIKELEDSIKKLQNDNIRDFGDYPEKENPASELVQFFIGIILAAVGLFMVFQCAQVSTAFGLTLFGSFSLPSGVVIVPLLIGIVMLFFCRKKFAAWTVTVIGILIILAALITSVRITWEKTSLFSFILMFGFIAAGGGLILKTLFKKRN